MMIIPPILPSSLPDCPNPPGYFNSEIAQTCILMTARIDGLYLSMAAIHSNTQNLQKKCTRAKEVLKNIEIVACKNNLLATSSWGTKLVKKIDSVSREAYMLGQNEALIQEFTEVSNALMWCYVDLIKQQIWSDTAIE
ncbi:MAG: hypothetical protein WCB03_00965 [Rouxiella badensis]|uniref:hypothetical protein n=1 Tax=Rouxiella badensis TaxID=1646377 RepID=UPI0012F75995